VCAFDDLALFTLAFGNIVFGITASGKITTKTHRDRACSDLSETRQHNDVGRGYGSRKTGCKSEGHSKSVGEPDDDITHSLGGLEVSFSVGSVGVWRRGYIMHGGSVVQTGGQDIDKASKALSVRHLNDAGESLSA
jgi:hypothetical protein